MAKSFNEVYETAKETTYSNATKALPLLASLNPVVRLTPTFKSNGALDGTTAKYNIQRLKRIKVTEVNNPNANTTTSALALLDGLSIVDWDTVGIATGVMKKIGIKKSINEEFDIDNIGEADAQVLAAAVEAEAVDRAERLLQLAIGANASVEFDDSAIQPIQWLDQIDTDVLKLQTLSDEFKHGTENMVILMHPRLVKLMSRVVGTQFQNEAPIFGTGLKSQFSYNGIPVLEDINLAKTFTDGATTPKTLANKVGYVILDTESLFFGAEEETFIDQTLAITRFTANVFYNVSGVIDPTRIITKVSKTGFGTAMNKGNA